MMSKLLNLFLIPLVLHILPAKADSRIIVLNTTNTVVLRGPIDAQLATNIQTQLAAKVLERGTRKYPIYLVLDSPGGSIDAGNMLIQFAKHIDNLNTISIFAASMASAIAEQLPGQRYVTQNGTLMFHKASAGAEGTVEVGSLEQRLYWIKKQVLSLEMANANRMRTSLADYKSLIANELWLDADDSVRYRAADEVIDIVCTSGLIDANNVTVFATMFGPASFTFSACPLFRVPFSGSSEKVKYNFGPSGFTSIK